MSRHYVWRWDAKAEDGHFIPTEDLPPLPPRKGPYIQRDIPETRSPLGRPDMPQVWTSRSQMREDLKRTGMRTIEPDEIKDFTKGHIENEKHADEVIRQDHERKRRESRTDRAKRIHGKQPGPKRQRAL